MSRFTSAPHTCIHAHTHVHIHTHKGSLIYKKKIIAGEVINAMV